MGPDHDVLSKGFAEYDEDLTAEEYYSHYIVPTVTPRRLFSSLRRNIRNLCRGLLNRRKR